MKSFEEVVHNFGKSDLIQWKSGFMANSFKNSWTVFAVHHTHLVKWIDFYKNQLDDLTHLNSNSFLGQFHIVGHQWLNWTFFRKLISKLIDFQTDKICTRLLDDTNYFLKYSSWYLIFFTPLSLLISCNNLSKKRNRYQTNLNFS